MYLYEDNVNLEFSNEMMKHLLGWWFKSLLLVLQAVLKSEFCVSEGLLWSGGALGCGQSDSFQVVLKDS